jgi:hypothetical protein
MSTSFMSDFCIATGVFQFGPGRSAFSLFVFASASEEGPRAIIAQKWNTATRFTILILHFYSSSCTAAIGQADLAG